MLRHTNAWTTGFFTAFGAVAILACFCATSQGVVMVEDRWADNDRTDPGSGNQWADNDNGTTPNDRDGDLEYESTWYQPSSTAGLSTTAGHLLASVGTSSLQYMTYFTPSAEEITLVNNGDAIRVMWQWSMSGVGTGNTSQNLHLGLVNTVTDASRLTADASAPADNYDGYGIWMNVSPTIGNSNPFQLRGRTAAASNFLNSTGDFGEVIANGATSGATGFASGTTYMLTWTITKNGAGVDHDISLTGGDYNNGAGGNISVNDATANSFAFDTWGIRPANSSTTASQFDTVLFKVEWLPIPEPMSIVLLGSALPALVLLGRRSIRRPKH